MHLASTRRAGLATTMAAVLIAAGVTPLTAQNRPPETQQTFNPITHEGFIEPPAAIKKLVDAPRNLNVSYGAPSPGTRKYFLRSVNENMPSLALIGAPHYNLAGWQIDHRGNRARTMTTRGLSGIELFDWAAGKAIRVGLPPNARAFGPQWSPDGSTVAYFANFDNATHIYLADAATGKSRALTRTSVIATNVTALFWTGDGRSIVTVLAPDGRAPEPTPPAIATEPVVRVNEANRLRTRTLPDLIENPFEKKLLEYHMTGQLAVIDVKSRAVTKVGAPGMIRSISASPDARHFRVTYLDQPFSYFQAINSWGTHEVLIDATGKVIREMARRPLRDGTQVDPDPDPDPTDPPDPNDPSPRDPTPGQGRGGQGRGGAAGQTQQPDTSRRSLTWHPYDGGLAFLQLSRVQGDSTRYVDRFVHLPNPTDSLATRVIHETSNRIQAVRFSDNGRILFVTETPPAAAGRGNTPAGAGGGRGRGGQGGAGAPGGGGATEIAVFLDEAGAKFTIPNRSGGGAGNTGGGGGGGGGGRGGGGGGGGSAIGGGGGAFVSKTGSRGNPVVMLSTDGKYVFAQGSARLSAPADTTLNRPFIEKVEIKTGNRERIYHSVSPIAETIVTALDDDFTRALIRRESDKVVGQQYILNVKSKEARQITNNKDYFPEIVSAQRKTLQARRGDGLPIRVRVTLPPDYKEGSKLPALFWFYPSEYDSAAAYERTLSAGRGGGAGGSGGGSYPSYGPRTMSFVTAAGYALIEPDAPIVATTGRQPNDNYVRDLRENLQAVITMLDAMGIVDRNRLAIGGHSYGGFSAVNAMVHTTFFKAGIAGDGNYNRTLTPNGFQRESRDLWQGRETYLAMSPFLYADQLSGALLMYHSLEDQNVGTDPINSPKLFHALQGLGKTVSLYMYPYEDHGPIARETMLDQWARWVAWLDKYVKNHGAAPKVISE
ncbi:MAG: prolyl oligopeptidase family serine peptidase [Gemmatimonadota bacterium]